MTDTVPAAGTSLPSTNIIAFPRHHRLRDPLDRQNLEHAFLAIHVAAQYEGDKRDGFVRQLIEEDRAGDLADILNNNSRAIHYLMTAVDFMMTADASIAEAADRFLATATAGGGAYVL